MEFWIHHIYFITHNLIYKQVIAKIVILRVCLDTNYFVKIKNLLLKVL